MPQLDSVSFLAQYFWAAAGFLVLYHLLVSGALPAFQRQLGARRSSRSEGPAPAFPVFLSSLFLFD